MSETTKRTAKPPRPPKPPKPESQEVWGVYVDGRIKVTRETEEEAKMSNRIWSGKVHRVLVTPISGRRAKQ